MKCGSLTYLLYPQNVASPAMETAAVRSGGRYWRWVPPGGGARTTTRGRRRQGMREGGGAAGQVDAPLAG